MSAETAEAAILALLAERAADATICPSEAARRIGGATWRDAMPRVHEAAAGLAAGGKVELRQGGAAVERPTGAYRIGHGKSV